MAGHRILAAAMCLAVGAPAWADAVTDALRERVLARDFDAAVTFAREKGDRFGEAEFDFWYGIAAIEAGRGGEGVLALERYRLSNPQDAQAALHLARGYLLLGEAARARAELDALLREMPEGELADAARTLLDAVRAQESAAGGGARFHVEAGLGADSNVNGGVGAAVVTLPVFGQVALPNAATKTGDNFAHFAAGAQASMTLEPGLSLFGGVDASTRLHTTDKNFDQNDLGAHAGVSLNRGGTIWRATLSHQTLWLENDRYRSVQGLAGEWASAVHPGGMLNAFVQYARFDYGAAGTGVRDADFYGVGAGYRHLFAGAMRPTLAVTLTLGDERNDQGRPDYSRSLTGATAAFSLMLQPRLSLSASLTHQDSRYRADDPLLAVTRRDRYDNLTLGLTYLIDRRWSVRGEAGYTDNRSNIPLYAYDRAQGAIKLRYEF